MSVSQQLFSLRRNAFLPLRNIAPGWRIACQEGVLWITYDAKVVDIVLQPGQEHVLRYRGAAVQALAPSRLTITPAAATPRPRVQLFAVVRAD